MLWKAFSDETGLELVHCFRQSDLVMQLGSHMKLFDQWIQLLFLKSNISVQKELINNTVRIQTESDALFSQAPGCSWKRCWSAPINSWSKSSSYTSSSNKAIVILH